MAELIEINIGTLDYDIKSMQEELRGLREEVKQTFDAVAELDSMWNGPANDAFCRAFQQDHQSMEELCRTMDELISFMETARDEYKKCEAAVSDEIDAIQI